MTNFKKIIPNDITVSEQFIIKNKLMGMIREWSNHCTLAQLDLEKMLNETGIKCNFVYSYNSFHPESYDRSGLCNFEIVDEKKYIWFTIKYA